MRTRTLCLRVENYVQLIRSIGKKYWVRLPEQVKLWTDLEDFIQDGVIFTRTMMAKFNPRLGNKFSTYLFVSLNRYFKARIESLTCEKRRRTKSSTVVLKQLGAENQSLYVDGPDSLDSLEKLYDEASPLLQSYMNDWFNENGSSRAVTTGCGFRKARNEFLELGRKYGLTARVVRDVLMANRMGVFRPALLVPEVVRRR